jgi:hypothetical protein
MILILLSVYDPYLLKYIKLFKEYIKLCEASTPSRMREAGIDERLW